MNCLYSGGSGVLALSFSPDGRWLARGAYDEKVEVWDVAAGARAFVYEEHRRSVYAVAFDPLGRSVASGDGEEYEKPGTLAVWDLDGRTLLRRRLSSDAVSGIAWRPDGVLLAACDFMGAVRIVDPTDEQDTVVFGAGVGALNAIVWDHDGRSLLVAGARGLQRLDAARGTGLGRWEAHAGGANTLALARDGRFASGGDDAIVRVWSRGGEPVLSLRHEGAVHGVAFSPDGMRLASASQDRTVRVWDAALGREIARHEFIEPALRMAFSPLGDVIAAGIGRHHGAGALVLLPVAVGS